MEGGKMEGYYTETTLLIMCKFRTESKSLFSCDQPFLFSSTITPLGFDVEKHQWKTALSEDR